MEGLLLILVVYLHPIFCFELCGLILCTGSGANEQQQPAVPGRQGASAAHPPWLEAPHLFSAIRSYLNVIETPLTAGMPTPQMPLTWAHVSSHGERNSSPGPRLISQGSPFTSMEEVCP